MQRGVAKASFSLMKYMFGLIILNIATSFTYHLHNMNISFLSWSKDGAHLFRNENSIWTGHECTFWCPNGITLVSLFSWASYCSTWSNSTIYIFSLSVPWIRSACEMLLWSNKFSLHQSFVLENGQDNISILTFSKSVAYFLSISFVFVQKCFWLHSSTLFDLFYFFLLFHFDFALQCLLLCHS